MNRPWFFPNVGVGVMLWPGVYEGQRGLWLRWSDQAGNPIPTGAERAEQEHQRAEQEATARAAAEAEIARLRAELERLQRAQG